MGLWALLSAPLLMCNDVRDMDEDTRRILMNEEVIAINQDKPGRQATRILKDGVSEVWMKRLSDGGYAIGFLNRDDEKSREISLPLKDLHCTRAQVRDLWLHKDLGIFENEIRLSVKPHECRLIKIVIE